MSPSHPQLPEDPAPGPGERAPAPATAEAGAPPRSDATQPLHVPRPLAARQYLWIVGAALVLIAALHWLGPVLTPFLIGAILAYLG
ncbi:MAG TPA: hypothetical protein VKT00_09610, partial [Casimicrobiaceae bacterium]|nr:hypothetical protein [Casimicrobiaceae bacterium]